MFPLLVVVFKLPELVLLLQAAQVFQVFQAVLIFWDTLLLLELALVRPKLALVFLWVWTPLQVTQIVLLVPIVFRRVLETETGALVTYFWVVWEAALGLGPVWGAVPRCGCRTPAAGASTRTKPSWRTWSAM